MLIEKGAIRSLAERIAQDFEPERIILFGSYAYGTPSSDSDVDLLIVMPHEGMGAAKALEIMQRVSPRIPVDLVVRSPEDVRRRLGLNDFFLREITDRGEILYESSVT